MGDAAISRKFSTIVRPASRTAHEARPELTAEQPDRGDDSEHPEEHLRPTEDRPARVDREDRRVHLVVVRLEERDHARRGCRARRPWPSAPRRRPPSPPRPTLPSTPQGPVLLLAVLLLGLHELAVRSLQSSFCSCLNSGSDLTVRGGDRCQRLDVRVLSGAGGRPGIAAALNGPTRARAVLARPPDLDEVVVVQPQEDDDGVEPEPADLAGPGVAQRLLRHAHAQRGDPPQQHASLEEQHVVNPLPAPSQAWPAARSLMPEPARGREAAGKGHARGARACAAGPGREQADHREQCEPRGEPAPRPSQPLSDGPFRPASSEVLAA